MELSKMDKYRIREAADICKDWDKGLRTIFPEAFKDATKGLPRIWVVYGRGRPDTYCIELIVDGKIRKYNLDTGDELSEIPMPNQCLGALRLILKM